MADRIKDDYGVTLGRKKVLRLMGEAKALSSVRRKHFSEEYYITRRQMMLKTTEFNQNRPLILTKRNIIDFNQNMAECSRNTIISLSLAI